MSEDLATGLDELPEVCYAKDGIGTFEGSLEGWNVVEVGCCDELDTGFTEMSIRGTVRLASHAPEMPARFRLEDFGHGAALLAGDANDDDELLVGRHDEAVDGVLRDAVDASREVKRLLHLLAGERERYCFWAQKAHSTLCRTYRHYDWCRAKDTGEELCCQSENPAQVVARSLVKSEDKISLHRSRNVVCG